jgi:hypothetical protein
VKFSISSLAIRKRSASWTKACGTRGVLVLTGCVEHPGEKRASFLNSPPVLLQENSHGSAIHPCIDKNPIPPFEQKKGEATLKSTAVNGLDGRRLGLLLLEQMREEAGRD